MLELIIILTKDVSMFLTNNKNYFTIHPVHQKGENRLYFRKLAQIKTVLSPMTEVAALNLTQGAKN